MKYTIILILFFVPFMSKGQDRIVNFYKVNRMLDDSFLSIYSDKRYKITSPFGADLPDLRTPQKDVVLSAGYLIQRSDTIILVDTINAKKNAKRTYKLLKISENKFKNISVKFYDKGDILEMYGFSNITQSWTFTGEIKSGVMNGSKIDFKNWIRYKIVNGIVTDTIKMRKND